jgi:ADP-ribosyltransferase exoenzyme
MKTFKQYTKQKEKEPVLIVNTHGSHSKKKEPVLIVNTHGSHSRNNNSYNESEEVEGTWEHYIKQEHNPGVTKPGLYQDKMAWLHKSHPLNPESHDHLRKYTQGSRSLADHFIKSHNENKDPIETNKTKHDIVGLDKAITDHTLRHKLTTFTGVGFNPEKLDSNKAVTHLSSSLSPKTAEGFAEPDTDAVPGKIVRHVIKHSLEKDHPAAIIGQHLHNEDGTFISDYPTENEVLLPRTDATKDKLHLHFNGYTDYPNKYGEIMRVHNGSWRKPE